jgi:carbon monoxide dehydrogenase subunit G
MQITHGFEVARTVDAVWEMFQDVPSVAQCLPGATLTEDKGGNVYAGNIAVKLGPIAATFEGEATITHDQPNRSALIDGRGVDKRGGSRGQVKVTYTLTPTATGGTRVAIDADVTLAGPAAQFGRTGLINEMSKRLISDFSSCLEAKMAAPTETAAGAIVAPDVKPIALLWAGLVAWLGRLIGRLLGRGQAG